MPATERNEILREAHDNKGHQGVTKTIDFLRNHFYWPHMRRDAQNWCASCDLCQKVQAGGTTPLSDEPTSQPERPLDAITMDLIKLESRQLIVIECLFSRFVEATLLENKNPEGVYKA